MTIPLCIPDLSGNEERYVRDVVQSTWISSGKYVGWFEEQFAAASGTRYCLAVSNGTVALHLALLTLGVGLGDEVIVPSLTYVATANAVRYCGAEPVFVDVDPKTWCINAPGIDEAVTKKTKAIIPVHLYGHPAEMDEINRIAKSRGLWVVEDAAEAHLAKYKGKPIGSLGDIGIFSFYGNKILTCGEGGALTVNDSTLDKRARMLRRQGMDSKRRYYFPVLGYNFRLSNLACAVLCAQLERREEIIARRREVFSRYRELLDGVPGIGFQSTAGWVEVAPWLFSITVDKKQYGVSRDKLAVMLARKSIETRPFFFPVHRLPMYRGVTKSLPITDHLAKTGLSLPTFPGMSDQEVEKVSSVIRESYGYNTWT